MEALTVAQLADRWGMTKQGVYYLLHHKRLRGYRLRSREDKRRPWRVPLSEVERHEARGGAA